MFRRAAVSSLKQVAVATSVSSRSMGMSTLKNGAQKSRQPSALLIGAAGAGLVGSVLMADLVNAREKKPDLEKIREEIVEIFDENNSMGPTLLRLAWHSSGTYSKHDGSGGSTGGTIRLDPEIKHGANAGLHLAVKELEKVKKNHPEISYADLYVYAGAVVIDEMGGPEIPFRLGRPDATSGEECTPDGRLPNADMGTKEKTTQHVRDIFYRMGFNDREIVALLGAHALGRCYTSRSGYSGPWTNAEWTFSNEYYRQLIENKWTVKKWNGPMQYEDPTGELMMLPADMVFLTDPEFRKYVELYAKDEDLFFNDFTAAFVKLTENGVQFDGDKKSGWLSWFK